MRRTARLPGAGGLQSSEVRGSGGGLTHRPARPLPPAGSRRPQDTGRKQEEQQAQRGRPVLSLALALPSPVRSREIAARA